ncbi:hypothetical protein FRB94_002703 [Tulasnella sp. JGI-2019a]|nr:hypothetical protein FRB94_002703 [Tulasnella sp. JGI-2019a]KAG9033248.1 hypothetical protein FRB95_000427 [Tulasnella sp. JGI-2019a]
MSAVQNFAGTTTLKAIKPLLPKGNEYNEKDLPQYTPFPYTMKAFNIWAAILPWLLSGYCATYIDHTFTNPSLIGIFMRTLYEATFTGAIAAKALKRGTWGIYWWFQGLIFTGIRAIGHECGHSAFSSYKWVCDIIGFVTHTFLWTPYFSWKIPHHHHHHSHHASMEKDDFYMPKTRLDLGLPRRNMVSRSTMMSY